MTQQRELLTFYLGDEAFAVDVASVREIVKIKRLTEVPLSSKGLRGLVNLRGQIVSSLNLDELLALDPPSDTAGEETNIIVEAEGELVGLRVDRPGDVFHTDPADIARSPNNLRGPLRENLEGVYEKEGRIFLILDLGRVLQSAHAA